MKFNCISKLQSTIYLLIYGYFQFASKYEIKWALFKIVNGVQHCDAFIFKVIYVLFK